MTSVDEKSSAIALAELLQRHVQPVIERNLRAKLRVSLKSSDFSQSNQEALEIAGEAKLALISELEKLKANPYDKSVQNSQSYVASVTITAYREYLRKKYPLRQQLKNKLRYLLTHHPEFEIRESEYGRICGFGAKMRMHKPVDSDYIRTEVAAKLDKANLNAPEQTIELVRRIFAVAESPIRFNDLLSLVGEIQGVKDKPEITGEEALLYQEKTCRSRTARLRKSSRRRF